MNGSTVVKGIVIFVCIAIIALVLSWNSITLGGAFDKHSEDTRRKTYESTKSYNDGKAQELVKLQYEYMKSEDKQKDAVAFRVRHMTASYELSKLSPDLRTFVLECRNRK